MTAPRLYLLAALPCLVALLFQPRGMEAQPVLSPEIQRRIERVCACLTTPMVDKGDPHACQTLHDRMTADRVLGISIAVIHHGEIEWAGIRRRSIGRSAGQRRNSVPVRQYQQTGCRDG